MSPDPDSITIKFGVRIAWWFTIAKWPIALVLVCGGERIAEWFIRRAVSVTHCTGAQT